VRLCICVSVCLCVFVCVSVCVYLCEANAELEKYNVTEMKKKSPKGFESRFELAEDIISEFEDRLIGIMQSEGQMKKRETSCREI